MARIFKRNSARLSDKRIVLRTVSLLLMLSAALPAAMWIEPAELPLAITARDYSAGPLTITGGSRCLRQVSMVQVVGGELPPGVSLTPSGYFRGTPSEPGTYQFIVRAANDCEAVQQEYTIEVSGAPVLAVEPASVSLAVPHGAPALEDPIVVQVRSSWNGTAYTASVGDASWLRAIPVRGTTPGPMSPMNSDALELHVDPSRLPPGSYRVLMRVSGYRTANSPVVPVTLRVLPPEGVAMNGPDHGPLAIPGLVLPSDPHEAHGDPHAADPHAPGPNGHGAPSAHPPAGGGHGHDATSHAAPAPRPAAPKVAAPAPQRLSRTGPVRRRFAASTPKAAAAPATGHEKPSPVGKPVEVAKAAPGHGAPAAAPAKPADSHGKPAGGDHGKPAASDHGKPAAKDHGKPANDHGKPAANDHGKPAANDHGKPAASDHGKPAAPKHEKH